MKFKTILTKLVQGWLDSGKGSELPAWVCVVLGVWAAFQAVCYVSAARDCARAGQVFDAATFAVLSLLALTVLALAGATWRNALKARGSVAG
jgi:hypothetical protein